MTEAVSKRIWSLDFNFENSPVNVIANRSCPEIKLAGLTVGPFEEGNEFEIQYWIAQELARFRIVRFRELEVLNSAKLHKIQWRERVQTAGQLSELPEEFYPKLRRLLKETKEEVTRKPEKLREYEKITQLTRDIVNSRLKKVVSLASAPAQTGQVLKNLASEERFLYERLYEIVKKWRAQILRKNEEGE